jgi:predicted secreted hydrolase
MGSWTSKRSGAEYPAGWHIRIPSLEIDIAIEPLIPDQELDTRGTTMIVYWEGACLVAGRRGNTNVNGRAYVELVGYDRSHESIGVTDFIFGKPITDLLPY